MGTKYSPNSASGYNSTPPSDDGSVSEANKVKWSTIKTKLTDPLETLAEAIDTDLQSHFDRGPTALTSNTTLGASHYNQIVQVSNSGVTLSLTDAATLGAGWYCEIHSTDSSNTTTISRATSGDTINGAQANFTLPARGAVTVFVNSAANGFEVKALLNPLGDNTITSTDAGAAAGPNITLDRNSASPAASDVLGSVIARGSDSGGGADTYASLQAEIVDPTATSEDGRWAVRTAIAGTLATRLYVGNGIYTVGGSDQGANTIQGFSGVYDGANRVYSAGNTVNRAGLNTTTASSSVNVAAGSQVSYTLTGSTYAWWTAGGEVGGGDNFVTWGNGNVAAGNIGIYNRDATNDKNFYVDERYVQASPPYTYGPMFIYLAINSGSKIVGSSVAPDPIWAYNGPTDITPKFYKNKKPFTKIKTLNGVPISKASKELRLRYLRGEIEIEEVEQEITLDFKDSDMHVVPHPFLNSNLKNVTIAIFEPWSKLTDRLAVMHKDLGDEGAREIRNLILDGYLIINNEKICGTGLPDCLCPVSARWKLTK